MSSLPILELPWVFSQSHPLSTSAVISELKKRGLTLDAVALREVYRRGDLQPIAEITKRRVRSPAEVSRVPAAGGSLQAELRLALASGRVRDPALEPYRPRIRFDSRRRTDPPRWRNGLIYSRWQLLGIPELRQRLTQLRTLGTPQRRRVDLPKLEDTMKARVEEQRRWALILMGLEARYLPTVDPEWLHLTNVEVEQWDDYRTFYDPLATANSLSVTSEEVRCYAEQLLHRARQLDPTGDWSLLIRRAPPRAWNTLRGDALAALDHRLGAEILLRFYEDLAIRGQATPLPEISSIRNPLHERISARRSEPVDSLLAHLGVSPHPGVVLAVEGETEERLVPRVFDHLGLRRTPDLVRVLCMRGADKQLALVAAATVAPLLGERHSDGYDMIRPPTRLVIAVDKDHRWDTDEKVANERRRIISEIEKVVAAQGASLSAEDLDTLVIVHRWPGRCFEFAHFTDGELASAMRSIHRAGGLSWSALVGRISKVRIRGGDVKEVWDADWIPKPAKPDLADALWPVLKKKIDDARWSETIEIPRVAEVVHEAYTLAQQSTYGTYVIRATDESEPA